MDPQHVEVMDDQAKDNAAAIANSAGEAARIVFAGAKAMPSAIARAT
jgi:hypothetical protein